MVAREEPSKGKALLLTGVTLVAERTHPTPLSSLEGKANVSEMAAPSLGFWTQKLQGLWPGLQDGLQASDATRIQSQKAFSQWELPFLILRRVRHFKEGKHHRRHLFF